VILAVLALTLAYAAVAALLLNLNLATAHPRWLKGAAIVVVTALYACAWHGTHALLGWPTDARMPERFRLQAILVDEPNRASKNRGGIYFWVRLVDEEGIPLGGPRSYVLPWTREIAQTAQSAQEALAGGALLEGSFSGSAAEVVQGDARGKGGSDTDGPLLTEPHDERNRFEFRRVPRAKLPPKPPPDGAQG
jgi:hypothetical protein